MKVLHISSEYPPQEVFGLGMAVEELAKASARLGHEVHVVTNSIQGKDQDVVADCVQVHRIPFPPPPKPPDGTSCVVQFNVAALETAVKALRRIGDVDLIHVHDWLVVLAGRMLQTIIDRPLVLTVHDTSMGKHFGKLGPAEAYAAELERWGSHDATRVICCSDHVRRELAGVYEVAEDKIVIIPCGVNPDRFAVEVYRAAFRSTFETPGSTFDKLALYVGRLDQEKGIEVLLDAMAQVVEAGVRAKLVVAGKGARERDLRERAAKLQLGDAVCFAGYCGGSALSALFQCADVLVCPSLYEPFGIVALEGMVNGTPVIVSDTGGLSEIVCDDAVGMCVPPGDAAALAQALQKVLGDDELAQGLGAAGQARAREVYSWDRIAVETVNVYERAIHPDTVLED